MQLTAEPPRAYTEFYDNVFYASGARSRQR